MGFTGKTYRGICLDSQRSLHDVDRRLLLVTGTQFCLAKQQGFITPTGLYRASLSFACVLQLPDVSGPTIVAIASFRLSADGHGKCRRGTDAPLSPGRVFAGGVIVLARLSSSTKRWGGFFAPWRGPTPFKVRRRPLVGFAIPVLVFREFGSLAEATRILRSPEKVAPPNWIASNGPATCSSLASVRSTRRRYNASTPPTADALRRSLLVMAFLPLTTAFYCVRHPRWAGAFPRSRCPRSMRSDTLLTVMSCRWIQEHSLVGAVVGRRPLLRPGHHGHRGFRAVVDLFNADEGHLRENTSTRVSDRNTRLASAKSARGALSLCSRFSPFGIGK